MLRVYEASGRPTAGARIKVLSGLLSAEETNLVEDSIRKMDVQADALRFDLGPFEIKTFRLQLRPLPGVN